MEEKKSGFAFHVHHNVLMEFCYDYDERVKYIKKHKPQGEQELRLRLFCLVPNERLPQVLVKACAAYGKAREAYDEAWIAYGKSAETYNKEAYSKVLEAYNKEAYSKVLEAYNEARSACNKAWEAYDKAWWEVCVPELNKLHKQLCPDCPWNGTTIFSAKER